MSIRRLSLMRSYMLDKWLGPFHAEGRHASTDTKDTLILVSRFRIADRGVAFGQESPSVHHAMGFQDILVETKSQPLVCFLLGHGVAFEAAL